MPIHAKCHAVKLSTMRAPEPRVRASLTPAATRSGTQSKTPNNTRHVLVQIREPINIVHRVVSPCLLVFGLSHIGVWHSPPPKSATPSLLALTVWLLISTCITSTCDLHSHKLLLSPVWCFLAPQQIIMHALHPCSSIHLHPIVTNSHSTAVVLEPLSCLRINLIRQPSSDATLSQGKTLDPVRRPNLGFELA